MCEFVDKYILEKKTDAPPQEPPREDPLGVARNAAVKAQQDLGRELEEWNNAYLGTLKEARSRLPRYGGLSNGIADLFEALGRAFPKGFTTDDPRLESANAKDLLELKQAYERQLVQLQSRKASAERLTKEYLELKPKFAGATELVERVTEIQQRIEPLNRQCSAAVRHLNAIFRDLDRGQQDRVRPVLTDYNQVAQQVGEQDRAFRSCRFDNWDGEQINAKIELGSRLLPLVQESVRHLEAVVRLDREITREQNDKLDEQANALGDSVTGEDAERLKRIFKARFNATVTGEFKNKGLPFLYNVFKLVPSSHTRDNEKLKLVERVKSGPHEGGGVFSRTENKIIIGALYTTGWGSGSQDKDNVTKGHRAFRGEVARKMSEKYQDAFPSHFSRVTLHEIGHAVDANQDFMGKHPGEDYGDWAEVKKAEIIRVMKARAGIDAPDLDRFLNAVYDNPVDRVDARAYPSLAPHVQALTEVLKWLKAGKDHLYKKGQGGATANVEDGYVYQDPYQNNQWWKYKLSARSKIVSDYQFRAAGEWFAEAYAAYFLGILPDDHPVAEYLEEEERKDQE